jgi:WhiB family transcriptional regulator, redox-sensing transcriptional regulator
MRPFCSEETVTRTTFPDPGAAGPAAHPKTTGGSGPGSWRESAACQQVDTELFFPVSRSGRGAAEARQAKAICARCPVRQPCLSYALATRQAYGIWGGYDDEERRVLHRRMEPAAARANPEPITAPVVPDDQATGRRLRGRALERGGPR